MRARGLVLALALFLPACSDDRTTTAEVKGFVGEAFPFLFSVRGYEATRQTRSVMEGQAYLEEGTILFVRKKAAKQLSAKKLQAAFVRAARARGFRPHESVREFDGTPRELDGTPFSLPSEKAWIDSADTRISTLYRSISDKELGGPPDEPGNPFLECRLWIAPDASRFAVWYHVVY